MNKVISGGLFLHLLGGFSVLRDGVPVAGFSYDKVRALLAFLAIEAGSTHSRERLSDLLWPEAERESARGSLRHALFSLKRALGPEGDALLRADRHSLTTLAAFADHVDFHEFSAAFPDPAEMPGFSPGRLERQAALYRGELLAGLSLPDAPDFESWLANRREQALAHALALHQRLAEYYEARGRIEAATAHLRRQVELAPWLEDRRRELIRLLAETGRPGEALREFEACRRYLDQELGVEPSLASLALVRRIRRHQPAESAPPVAQAARQRLPATVLVCRLRTGPGDSEDALDELAASRAVCAEAAAARGGHFVPMQADLFMAYFGYPISQELAPRRAVEAALEMAARLAAQTLAPPAEIRCAFGLHVGWMLADDSLPLPDVLGHVSRPALALAEGGADGTVNVSEEVRAAVEGYFRFAALEAVGVYRVLGATGAADRLAASSDLTPLVGRRDEIRKLAALWAGVERGRAGTVLLSGDAGIGKSRLVQAVARQVELSGGAVCELRCQPEGGETPYFPLVDFLEKRYGTKGEASVRLAALAARLREEGAALADCLPVLAHLLNLPSSFDGIADLAVRKRQIEAAIQGLLIALADARKLLLVVEDVHWADPSTLHALARFRDANGTAGDACAMLLMTSRLSACSVDAIPMHLDPLAPAQAEELAQRVGGGEQSLPADRLATVLARADGVPLYIEQMVRRLRDTDGGDLPVTLRDLLAARLEALGDLRSLAQRAAVIGREFDVDLLAALAGGREAADGAVRAGLARMCEAMLVRPEAERRYVFRHALIRDAAYLSMPAVERRALHLRLLEVLQADFPDWLHDHPELRARHLDAAAHADAAAAWLAAGLRTAARSAQGEAREQLRAGLQALARVGDTQQRLTLEFRLQAALGNVLVALQGYGSSEAQQAYARAFELSGQVADDAGQFQVMWGLWLKGRPSNGEAPPLVFAEKLARMAEGSDDPAVRLQLDYAFANNYFWLGRYDKVRLHAEAAIARIPRVDGAQLVAQYGEDGGVTVRAFLAWTLWFEGRADDALAVSGQALAAARAGGHVHSLGFALTFAATLHRYLDQPAEVLALARELAVLAESNGLLMWQVVAGSLQGWVAAAAGDAGGLQAIRNGAAGARQIMPVVETSAVAILVDGLCRVNRFDEARGAIEAGVATARLRKDLYILPELLRCQGEILLRLDEDAAAAEACFAESLELAQAQGAHALRLRSATSLARLWEAQGRRAAAADLLRGSYESLDQGFATADLRTAEALLARLAA